ncbi:MAG: glycoside hydrolase family 3 C-terminal domain-containing protein, partial [Tannerella sp.]|nr:glycoside hydrolase family 3 C-terminal domain-containing protein [Tannerella sp.]
MKKNLLLLAVLFCALTMSGQSFPFQNPDLTIEQRVNDLVSRMTLEEKVSQMVNSAAAIERLGIPAYNWWNEALHGIARSPYPATSYPQAIGMAATWNPEAVRQMATFTSDEGRAIYNDAIKKGRVDIYCGLTYWTPNINIFRDPRWGRGQETYGEDPVLTGTIGAAFVSGLQGDDPRYLKASACAKHYAVHSGPEWNRHEYDARPSTFDLWDTYLPAFRRLIVDEKVTGVMCAYNAFFGQPCCGSDELMLDILYNQWNFDGYVTSDCGAINDFYMYHKTHADAAEASADAVIHGTDCDCGNAFKALVEAVQRGEISTDKIDTSVKRLFTIRFRLGMFDPADRVPYANIPLSVLEAPAHQAHALKMAQESIVLLKNEGSILPLDRKKIRKIAVVGPNADEKSVLLANYFGNPTTITTVLEGIKAKAGKGVQVVYEKGVNLTDNLVFKSAYNPALFTYQGKPGFKAEYFQNTRYEGAPGLTRVEKLVDYRWGDSQQVASDIVALRMSARWTTTFTPRQSGEVCFELRADDAAELYINGEKQTSVGLINSYYVLNAEKGKQYEIRIDYRQNNENGLIKFDFGTLQNTDYNAVASSVADADVIVYAGGISARVEGEEMRVEIDGFKRGDRTSIALPAVQTEMLKALHATGKPVVFVLMTGSAIGLEWESQHLPAIVNAWYGGQAAGQAIADVLFGDYNPAGRLP